MASYAYKLQFDAPSSTFPGSWFRVEGRYLPGDVYMKVGRGANGQLLCTGLFIDSPKGDVTTSSLREIPVSKLLSGVIEQFNSGEPEADPVWNAIEEVDLPAPGPSGFGRMVVFDATPKVSESRPRRGGGTPSTDRLARFAEAYKAALNSPEYRRKPIARAAELSGISVATAHRWRERCQEKGLLDAPAK